MAEFNPSQDQLDTLAALFGKSHTAFSGLDDIEYSIPTRVESFNLATNYGGLPIGVLFEIHGPEYVGKTAHLLSILADAQKAGHVAAYYELEPATTHLNAETLGIDLKSLITWKHVADLIKPEKDVHPKSFEHISKCTNRFIMNFEQEKKSGQCLVIGIDSAVALAPNKQIYEGINESNYGALTKLYGDWMRTLNTLVCKSGYVTVIFTNQEREVVGAKGPFARQWRIALGPAFHYWFQLRERLTHRESIKSGENIIGRIHHGEIRKTKRGIDGKKFDFYTKSSMGLWIARELSECGLKHGVIKKSKGSFTFNNSTFTNRAELEAYVLTHKRSLRQAIREVVKE